MSFLIQNRKNSTDLIVEMLDYTSLKCPQLKCVNSTKCISHKHRRPFYRFVVSCDIEKVLTILNLWNLEDLCIIKKVKMHAKVQYHVQRCSL